MKVIYKLNKSNLNDLFELYKKEWWTKNRSLNDLKIMVENSTVVIGLLDINTDSLVGFCRVLTDKIYKAVIFDFIVSEKFRNKGLSKILFLEIFNHPDLLNVNHFELYCLAEMQGYYEQYGFNTLNSSLCFMRKIND